MEEKEIRNTIQQTFITQWASATDVALDNQKYKPGDSTTEWVRLSIQFNDGGLAAIGGEEGNRLFRIFGLIFVQVFTLLGSATDNSDDLCKDAKNIFEQEMSGIWFRNVHVVSVPTRSNEKWYQQNVVGEFIVDDIH